MKSYRDIILLMVILGINLFFRLGPASLPFSRRQAANSVRADYQKAALAAVEEKFKDLPQPASKRARETILKAYLKENAKEIQGQIRLKEKELRAYWQDDAGQTFLLEYDPYHWLRLVKNLNQFGRVADRVVGGVEYDTYMLAPAGMKAEVSLHRNLHVVLSFLIFKALTLFNKAVTPEAIAFYLPLVVSSLAVAAVFFLCRSITKDPYNSAGIFAALILGLSPVFMDRSLAGWFDTDGYIVFFSLLTAWAFYAGLSSLRTKRNIWFSLSGGLSIGLFSFSWDGWWYIFDLILLAALYYAAHLLLLKRKKVFSPPIKPLLISLSAFTLAAAFSVGLLRGINALFIPFSGVIKLFLAKDYLHSQFWPNAFYTVKELRGTDIAGVIAHTGGPLFFFFSLIYWLIVLLRKDGQVSGHSRFIAFLLIFWFLIISFVATRAVRFSLLMTLPLSISAALFLAGAIDFIILRFPRLRQARWPRHTAVAISACLILLGSLDSAFISRNIKPLMDKDWYAFLKRIRQETPAEAIINSWWDYGHWLKAVAERRVIFDGATQDTALSYWMGRVLVTADEREAVGILRMINSGSNSAFRELRSQNLAPEQCLRILKEMILLDRQQAEELASQYLPPEEVQRLIGYTHQPQQAYFLLEPGLTTKIISVSFLGNWDFQKADIYLRFKQGLKQEDFRDYLLRRYGIGAAEADNLRETLAFLDDSDALSWISQKVRPFQQAKETRREQGLVFFENGTFLDLSSGQLYLAAEGKESALPKRLLYLAGEEIRERSSPEASSGVSAILLEEDAKYRVIFCDDSLLYSMFSRLYFLGGKGLRHFRQVMSEQVKDGQGRIILYSIEW